VVAPLVPVELEGLAIARSSTNFGSLALADPAVPLVPVVVPAAGARWTHPVTVIVLAALELLLCGVVCAAIPTDRIMATAAHAPDRTIVFILPPLFQEPGWNGCNLEASESGCAVYARGIGQLEKSTIAKS